jgi:hypothetical protein
MGKPSFPFVPVNSVETLGRKHAVANSEALGRKLDFYAIRTTLDIRPGPYGSDSQERLNALIEVIGLRAQPIIVSVEPVEQIANPSDLPAGQNLGTTVVTPEVKDADGNVTTQEVTAPVKANVYTLRFALEHFGAWEGATPSLAESLDGVAGFVFAKGATDNVSVIRYAAL